MFGRDTGLGKVQEMIKNDVVVSPIKPQIWTHQAPKAHAHQHEAPRRVMHTSRHGAAVAALVKASEESVDQIDVEVFVRCGWNGVRAS